MPRYKNQLKLQEQLKLPFCSTRLYSNCIFISLIMKERLSQNCIVILVIPISYYAIFSLMVRSKQYNYSSLSDNSAFNKAVIKKSKSVSDQIILYNKEQVALFFV